MRNSLKWLLHPGINLHARLRNRRLPAYFGRSSDTDQIRRVLDAGCGNGMLSYQSYLRGNEVLGLSIKDNEVAGCRRLFNQYLGIPEDRLRFKNANLYDIEFQDAEFDEIICTEVLEHIRDDDEICMKFWRALKPGGALHITAPNSAHPYNRDFPIDEHERGGHVRPGYTLAEFKSLLEPIGFKIELSDGLGGPVRQAVNRRIKEVQRKYGVAAGVPLFALAPPLLLFDSRQKERDLPFSIYVKAIKPKERGA
ncbi:MAG: class I SAM-dependent methyltransferase [Pseudomonadota bacterium]